MKTLIQDLKIGQTLKESRWIVEVAFIYADKFEVQYTSGVCRTYRQIDLDNGTIQTYIG
jgi:hypothetical protein